ncbi:hypothetical protein [Azohydromonas caseinilytica]|uniref:Uncharacterized protein n=1 Tax=Azohydromonas caseinilytica TaxID=2728836 RepID=A0A848F3U2_9BURK|nr:hypothetical protein [Azohydromonas caseinilytica]NML13365.1 hypothetical protein [Azohydromonas caseinilytica]
MNEHALPSQAHRLAEGETHATDWGARFTRTGGELVAELPQITSVGLCNLCEVYSHEVVHVAGMASHHVCFLDGGELRFAYNERGELVELYARGAAVAIGKEGRVMAAMAGSTALREFRD